jgi:hypothetical protein
MIEGLGMTLRLICHPEPKAKDLGAGSAKGVALHANGIRELLCCCLLAFERAIVLSEVQS